MHDVVDRHHAAPLDAPAIPATLNIVIAVGAIAIATGCLWLASHAPHWTVVIAAAFIFSFANNTIFSLLHECVHGTFHPRRRINDAAGVLFAAFFPTSFTSHVKARARASTLAPRTRRARGPHTPLVWPRAPA